MSSVIDAPDRPALMVKEGVGVFPAARIFGIGRNYSKTPALEKKNKDLVVLFMKDAFMLSNVEDGIVYPNDTAQLRYEIELVVAVGKSGKNIAPDKADDHIYGYAVGIDFTKYDAQAIAKQHAWPWDQGKSFEGCAPCSEILPKERVRLDDNVVWLNKNNIKVQVGSLSQMIWKVPEIVSLISSRFGLLPGDLIFTGTPEGVGMVSKGDFLEGGIAGVGDISFEIK